jgi:hypothetical protein
MRYCSACARFALPIAILLIASSSSEAGLFRRARYVAPPSYEPAGPRVVQVSTSTASQERVAEPCPTPPPTAPCVEQSGWSNLPRSTADFGRWPPYFN